MQIYYDDHLAHYGVGHLQGGHSGRYPWGSGKYTNPDGTLTEAGKKRYLTRYGSLNKRGERAAVAAAKRGDAIASSERAKQIIESRRAEIKQKYDAYWAAHYDEQDMFDIYMERAYTKFGFDSDFDEMYEWVKQQPEYAKTREKLLRLSDEEFKLLKDITNDVKADSMGDFRFLPNDLSEYERAMSFAIARLM